MIYILAGYQKEDEDNLGIDTYIYYRYFGKSYWNTGGISQYLLLLIYTHWIIQWVYFIERILKYG